MRDSEQTLNELIQTKDSAFLKALEVAQLYHENDNFVMEESDFQWVIQLKTSIEKSDSGFLIDKNPEPAIAALLSVLNCIVGIKAHFTHNPAKMNADSPEKPLLENFSHLFITISKAVMALIPAIDPSKDLAALAKNLEQLMIEANHYIQTCREKTADKNNVGQLCLATTMIYIVYHRKLLPQTVNEVLSKSDVSLPDLLLITKNILRSEQKHVVSIDETVIFNIASYCPQSDNLLTLNELTVLKLLFRVPGAGDPLKSYIEEINDADRLRAVTQNTYLATIIDHNTDTTKRQKGSKTGTREWVEERIAKLNKSASGSSTGGFFGGLRAALFSSEKKGPEESTSTKPSGTPK